MRATTEPKIALSVAPADEIKTTTCYMCACRCGIRVHLKDGKVRVVDVPPPELDDWSVTAAMALVCLLPTYAALSASISNCNLEILLGAAVMTTLVRPPRVATAVLLGWRPTTIDIDVRWEPERDELFRAIPTIKEELQVNIEAAWPFDFIPEPPGWRDRCRFIVAGPTPELRHRTESCGGNGCRRRHSAALMRVRRRARLAAAARQDIDGPDRIEGRVPEADDVRLRNRIAHDRSGFIIGIAIVNDMNGGPQCDSA